MQIKSNKLPNIYKNEHGEEENKNRYNIKPIFMLNVYSTILFMDMSFQKEN